MIQVADLQIFEDMPFDEYLSLPGISYSAIVSDGVDKIQETEKMRFGSLVDAYLFEPHNYNGEKYNLVRPVARTVKEKLGPLLTHGKRQLVVTCKMIAEGIYIVYKGRIDLFAGGIVIDLKVSELPIINAIKFFGYDKQVSGYSIPLKAQVAVIVSVHPKKHTVSTAPVVPNHEWWRRKILEYGSPC